MLISVRLSEFNGTVLTKPEIRVTQRSSQVDDCRRIVLARSYPAGLGVYVITEPSLVYLWNTFRGTNSDDFHRSLALTPVITAINLIYIPLSTSYVRV